MNVIILIFLSLTALDRDSWDRQTHVGRPCGASPNSLATRRSAISSFPARCWLPVRHGKNSSEFEFHGYHSVESGARFPTPDEVPETFIPTPLGIPVSFSTVLQHSRSRLGDSSLNWCILNFGLSTNPLR
ncbi:hypothetical protein BDV30DRAFT_117998 [Aspergillus minisclerotigenes]|uniref:Secreted protein n=1 Tax=Aspergillus minisclerotigenes TaxID=656917 RepID=A0A5N6J241_9EURO|nr:hypothetical protein BDV30DRAFT_117998 [Aspergillus minisclerotigenes]